MRNEPKPSIGSAVVAVLLNVVGWFVAKKRSSSSNTSPFASKAPEAKPAGPPPKAWIYRAPNEIAFRMKVGHDLGSAKPMGIFGSWQFAQKLARKNGYELVYPTYKDV